MVPSQAVYENLAAGFHVVRGARERQHEVFVPDQLYGKMARVAFPGCFPDW